MNSEELISSVITDETDEELFKKYNKTVLKCNNLLDEICELKKENENLKSQNKKLVDENFRLKQLAFDFASKAQKKEREMYEVLSKLNELDRVENKSMLMLEAGDIEFAKYILSILISSLLDFDTVMNELYNKEQYEEEYNKACEKLCRFLEVSNFSELPEF